MIYRKKYPRICPYCNTPFEAKSKSAIYCSNGCRVMKYKIRHGIPIPDFQIKKIANRIPSKTEIAITERTSELQEIKESLQLYNKEYQRLLATNVEPVRKELEKITKYPDTSFEPPDKRDNQNNNTDKFKSILIEIYEKLGYYDKVEELKNKSNKIILRYRFERVIESKEDREKLVENARRLVYLYYNDMINNEMKKCDDFKNIYQNKLDRANRLQDEIEALHKGFSVERLLNSGKIIGSDDISNMNYDLYQFEQDFEKVFGHPDKHFVAMIHGSSGSGKSSFCVKFASYFAENFGTVCYLPLEEGTSFSFKRKIDEYCNYGHFHVIDERSPGKIQKLSDTYSLLVLDSISYLEFSVSDIEEIIRYRRNTGTSFLFVTHDNKDGTYKGESSLGHLVDIILHGNNGLITAQKNRYKLNNLENYEYRIFAGEKG